ncbi:hypothetical protein CFOL_v3_00282 [Cephalotus follicularis]|uniref:TFIIS N-terminal domain-containing protein n=1 Tax=Cephalotus follicularis TaxID=3775 RepID=A0A1Q3AM85_CEPFO|nr:hypothetical protein CFOL_v3_00282 [Cephalotus follicularis]
MILEDFFTLTEMKDGLTAPSRVEELVNIMQEEKNCVVKNIGDATRQWAAVASTLAATENKDCLDRFIQLDGLWFIDRWLKDAQQYGSESSDSFVEESILALLRALEKLNIDNERSISSGIWSTVRNLLGHNSSWVQDRARALFDSWKQGKASDAIHQGAESVGAYHDDGFTKSAMLSAENSRRECSLVDVPVSRSLSEEDNRVQPAEPEILPLRSSEVLQPGCTENQRIQTLNKELHSHIILDHADTKDGSPDNLASSVVSNSVEDQLSMKEKSQVNTVDGTETCNLLVLAKGSAEGQSDALELNEFSKDEKQVHRREQMAVTASASDRVEAGAVYSAASAQENVTDAALQNSCDSNDGDSCLRSPDIGDVGKPASEPKSGINNAGVTSHCSPGQDDECHSDTLQDMSTNKCIYGKPDQLEASFSRIEDLGRATDKDKEQTSDDGEDFSSSYDFRKPVTNTRSPDVSDSRRSDIDLDIGMDDALEVARKVAQEVEREVVDYKEPSCSSSEKILEGGIHPPNSPDSIDGKQHLPTESPGKEVTVGQNHSDEAYPEEGYLITKDKLKSEPGNGINEMESSQVTEGAQELDVNTEKGFCDFDLNQEVCSDDMDLPVDYASGLVSVVSASRPAAALGLPASPLQFEGTLGWKGSAATSAFRPASPRRFSDGDKTLSIGVTSNGSNLRQGFLDFDLNVAEGGDDKPSDLMAGKQITVSSDLHSAESSMEVSPRRSERLKLDLNRISDDDDAQPQDLKVDGRLLYNRNGHHSPSPASSISSMQPSMRNIDLNDRPYLHNDYSDQGFYQSRLSQNVSAYVAAKPEDAVISIMGTRVEVNRKDSVPPASPFSNGKALEHALDAHLPRGGGLLGMGPAVPYTHSLVFGYNGLTTAPAMSFYSAMHGPGGSIPCMMNTRGATVVGSASPFIMSTPNGPSCINSAGPSQPSSDMSFGFAIEGGNRESVGLRQLLMPGHGVSVEEHLRANSQTSSSSGVGVKRKEPDSGWEPYPFNYRHQQPPWK